MSAPIMVIALTYSATALAATRVRIPSTLSFADSTPLSTQCFHVSSILSCPNKVIKKPINKPLKKVVKPLVPPHLSHFQTSVTARKIQLTCTARVCHI